MHRTIAAQRLKADFPAKFGNLKINIHVYRDFDHEEELSIAKGFIIFEF